jgi:tRNA 2-thiouridine synthesizing protein A
MALEDLESGQVLEVVVDHEPATENVPRSMERDGHRVLEVKKIEENTWRIVIQKI